MSMDLLEGKGPWIHLVFVFAPLVLILVVVLAKRKPYSWSGDRLVPGPYGLPLLGCVHLFSPLASTHVRLARLSSAYGPVYQVRLGTKRVLVVNSVDTVKETLRLEDCGLPSFQSLFHGLVLLQGERDAPYQTTHMEQDVAIPVGVHTAERTMAYVCSNSEQLCSAVNSTVEELTGAILATEGSAFEPSTLVERHLLGLTFRLVFGQAPSRRNLNESQEILHELKEFLPQAEAMLMYVDCLPFGKLFLQPHLHQLPHLIADYMTVIREICSEHPRLFGQQTNQFSLMHALQGTNQNFSSPFTRNGRVARASATTHDLAEEVFTIYHEVSTCLAWGLVLLARYTHIQEELAGQLKLTSGDRQIQLSDKAKVPLLEAVVLEVMRLSNSAPLRVGRLTTQDTTVNGFRVPRGTSVLVNSWACSRDPKYFTQGSKFNPHRFLNSAGCLRSRGPAVNVPIGVRKWLVTKSILILTLGCLVKDFRLRLRQGSSPLSDDDGFAAESTACKIIALRRQGPEGWWGHDSGVVSKLSSLFSLQHRLVLQLPYVQSHKPLYYRNRVS